MRYMLLCSVMVLASASEANLIVNGSFEQPDVAAFGQYFNGQTIGSGWTAPNPVAIATIIDNSGAGTIWHHTSAGEQALYVGDSLLANYVVQTVQLVAGVTYDMSYMQAAFDQNGSWTARLGVHVLDSAGMQASQVTDLAAGTGFTAQAFSFTADETGDHVIKLEAYQGRVAHVDDVKLVEAVPEPGTMTALALGGAFLARRRRR